MTTIIMNHSILDNGDLAQMAFEAVDTNEMQGGLWAIHIDPYGMFDCSFMARTYKPGYHNAIVSVDIAPKEVTTTQTEPQDIPIEVGSKWSYMGMEPDTVIAVTDEEIITESPGRTSESGWSRKEFLTFYKPQNPPVSLDLARENGFPRL